jgi:hypothetical protein
LCWNTLATFVFIPTFSSITQHTAFLNKCIREYLLHKWMKGWMDGVIVIEYVYIPSTRSKAATK